MIMSEIFRSRDPDTARKHPAKQTGSQAARKEEFTFQDQRRTKIAGLINLQLRGNDGTVQTRRRQLQGYGSDADAAKYFSGSN